MSTRQFIKRQVEELNEEVINLRRDFHTYPELGFKEFRTSKIVYNYLKDLGLEVSNMAKTGVVGLLRGKEAGKTVMLRADMDAIHVQEENEIPYKSKNDGVMHACAHDGHTAMLLVAAKILTKYKDKIKGNIKFVFQPNEEDAGAKYMVEEGVLENPKVDAALGIHLWSPIESGKVGISGGPVMAAHQNFKLEIIGKGGHSGSPHTSIDPIITAANIIQTIQTIQTREIDVLKPTLIMFGEINGGSAPNVIPSKVELEGSIRYLYEGGDQSPEQPEKRFERMVEDICSAYRAGYTLNFIPSNGPLINDDKLADKVAAIAEDVVGKNNIIPYVCMAGEDFSEFASRVPSVFYFVGTGNKDKGTDFPHHHPRFNIDEDTLALGVEMHVRTALSLL